jgi:shikimate kinase
LRATVDTLAERVADVAGRPLLTGSSHRETLARLHAERQSGYAAAADFSIDTDSLTPDEVVALIEAMWNA